MWVAVARTRTVQDFGRVEVRYTKRVMSSQRIRQAVLQRDYARLDGVGLDPEQLTRYVAVLVRVAALDDITVQEHVLVERIAAVLGLTEEGLARAFLIAEDRKVTTETLLAGLRDRGLRVCLLRDAYRLAAADLEVTAKEVDALGRIASALAIAPEVASEIRTIALQESALSREFSKIVRAAENG